MHRLAYFTGRLSLAYLVLAAVPSRGGGGASAGAAGRGGTGTAGGTGMAGMPGGDGTPGVPTPSGFCVVVS